MFWPSKFLSNTLKISNEDEYHKMADDMYRVVIKPFLIWLALCWPIANWKLLLGLFIHSHQELNVLGFENRVDFILTRVTLLHSIYLPVIGSATICFLMPFIKLVLYAGGTFLSIVRKKAYKSLHHKRPKLRQQYDLLEAKHLHLQEDFRHLKKEVEWMRKRVSMEDYQEFLEKKDTPVDLFDVRWFKHVEDVEN